MKQANGWIGKFALRGLNDADRNELSKRKSFDDFGIRKTLQYKRSCLDISEARNFFCGKFGAILIQEVIVNKCLDKCH